MPRHPKFYGARMFGFHSFQVVLRICICVCVSYVSTRYI